MWTGCRRLMDSRRRSSGPVKRWPLLRPYSRAQAVGARRSEPDRDDHVVSINISGDRQHWRVAG